MVQAFFVQLAQSDPGGNIVKNRLLAYSFYDFLQKAPGCRVSADHAFCFAETVPADHSAQAEMQRRIEISRYIFKTFAATGAPYER